MLKAKTLYTRPWREHIMGLSGVWGLLTQSNTQTEDIQKKKKKKKSTSSLSLSFSLICVNVNTHSEAAVHHNFEQTHLVLTNIGCCG